MVRRGRRRTNPIRHLLASTPRTTVHSVILDEAVRRLEALGNDDVRARNSKLGVGDNQFGVKLGDIRSVAREIGKDSELAMALWETGNVDAQLLAILLLNPRKLSVDELDRMVRSVATTQVADWLNAYLVRKHPKNEALRTTWLEADDPMAARSAWDLTAQRVAKNPDGLDVAALLDRIESELAAADPATQWTMNNTLAEIGINIPEQRERAIGIGEMLGVYRDYPVSKGCTSPFAPLWIKEMVGRQA